MTAAQGDAVEWMCVPREPTKAMRAAANAVYWSEHDPKRQECKTSENDAGLIYAAMLAAAPKLAPGCGLLVEQAAITLWHRFAPDSQEEWEYETHKADYRLAAEAVLALAIAPPAPVSEDAARLDWLDSQWVDGVHVEVCAKVAITDRLVPISTVFSGRPQADFKAGNVRAAIDAAMQEPKP